MTQVNASEEEEEKEKATWDEAKDSSRKVEIASRSRAEVAAQYQFLKTDTSGRHVTEEE